LINLLNIQSANESNILIGTSSINNSHWANHNIHEPYSDFLPAAS